MRITKAGEYAIRCVLYLSTKGKGTLVSKKEIAESCAIPPQFLSKIAQDLARAKLIEIKQGPRGGFILTKDPKNISLLKVLEAIIGEIFLNDCIARPESCEASSICIMHDMWMDLRKKFRSSMDEINFAQLTKDPNHMPFLTLAKSQ